MGRYLLQRASFGVMSLFAATIIVFGLSRATGDPLLLYAKPGGYGVSPDQVAALKKKLALDKPLIVQYLIWAGRVMKGDMGNTILAERPVSKVVMERLPNTVILGVAAWTFATVIGIPLGILSAVKRGTFWDYLGRGLALFGQALPQFWVGIVAILIFAVYFGWLPSGTMGDTKPFFPDRLKHLILPTITLGWTPMAAYLRITRSAMLDVLDAEYVKLARAKGVTGWAVIGKHAFRNALIPPLTVSALILVGFLDGAVLVESVFSWPGVGRLALDAIFNNDFPLLTGVILIFAMFFVLGSLVADFLYVVIDPRIRYTS
jgi:peptide/nickel transport system permease protein